MARVLAFAFRTLVVLCGIIAAPAFAREAVDDDWENDWQTCQRVILNGPDRRQPGAAVAQYCEDLRSLFGQPGVEGTGVPRNPATAFWWYRKAAAQGHATALFKVGHAYELGIGTAMNKVKAGQYYQQAADRGSPDAKKVLAFWRDRKCCVLRPR